MDLYLGCGLLLGPDLNQFEQQYMTCNESQSSKKVKAEASDVTALERE